MKAKLTDLILNPNTHIFRKYENEYLHVLIICVCVYICSSQETHINPHKQAGGRKNSLLIGRNLGQVQAAMDAEEKKKKKREQHIWGFRESPFNTEKNPVFS